MFNTDEDYEESTGQVKVSEKKWLIALLLCFFLGGLGAHRFYLGYYKTAIAIILLIWVFAAPTGGISDVIGGIWVIIDLILILFRKFKAADGRELASWR